MTAHAISRGHRFLGICLAAQARRNQDRALRKAQAALDKQFTAYGTELGKVDTFRYLGRPLASTDSDWPTVHWNMSKAKKRWAQVSRILKRDGGNPRIQGMFYKAIVQSVLLYGVETWVTLSPMMKTLQGFHHRVARGLTRRRARRQNGVWVYPPVKGTLQAAGLHPIEVYMDRRRRYLKTYLQKRPLLQICKQSKRLPGTPTRTKFWWETSPLEVA